MELWEPKQRIERAYRRNLLNISRYIIGKIGDTTNLDFINKIMKDLISSREYQQFAESVAMKMVTHLFVDQGKTWKQAAALNGKGGIFYTLLQREIKEFTGKILQEQIQRNAEIIKTLPLDIASDITQYVSRESLKGRRAFEIAKEIKQMFPKQTKARAELIARTEVSKTQSRLTEIRCRRFNINWYVWRAVGGGQGDGRTRDSHKKMNGVFINWNEPPAPENLFPQYSKKTGRRYKNTVGNYHAGCCPNCRCYAEPVIDLSQYTFPIKIYYNGKIKMVSRKAFEKIM